MRRLPTTTISRTLRGASQEIWTLAVAPLANVEREERRLGHVRLEDAARRRGDLDDRLVEPVEQDRQVVRREVADHPVRLVLAEVHARRRDEVDLAERRPARISSRTLLTGGLYTNVWPGHEHQAARLGDLDQVARVRGRGRQRLLDQHVLAGVQRRARRSRGGCAAAWRRSRRRSSGRRAPRRSRSTTGTPGTLAPRTPPRARRRARRARRAPARGARSTLRTRLGPQ